MNPVARRILELYDQLERESLDLHTLLEMAGGNPPAQREAVLDLVSEMVKKGLLRADSRSDFYIRTEDGRLAVVSPRTITLYTRAGCHLCAEAKREILPLLTKYCATLRELNIDDDRTLLDRYSNDVPVILLGTQKIAEHHVDAATLRRALEQAKQ